MVVRRIGPISLAKIVGSLYAVFGLMAGLLFSLLSFVIPSFVPEGQPGGGLFAIIFGVGAVLVLPLVYGLLGFLMMLITALLYNALAGSIGGIQLDLENDPPPIPGLPVVGPGS